MESAQIFPKVSRGVPSAFLMILVSCAMAGCSGEIEAPVRPSTGAPAAETKPDTGTAAKTKGWTALHQAATKGDAGMVGQLLDRGNPIDPADDDERTPLFVAAKEGHLAVVQLLIQRGAAIDVKAETGSLTPLHTAAEHKRVDVVKFLLAKGANVNARNDWDETPLHLVSRQPWHKDSQVGEVLLDHGADKEARTDKGLTPLMVAAENGHLPLVKILLTKGADPFTGKVHAIELAHRKGQNEVVGVLFPLYDQEVARQPSQPRAYYNRGLAFLAMVNEDRAIHDFDKALALAPSDFTLYQQVDRVLTERKKWDYLIAMWTTYIKQHPRDGRAYLERSGTYSHKRDEKRMREDASTACALGERMACDFAGPLKPRPM